MFNWVLSVLVNKGMLAVEEAEHLAKELVVKTHPSNFKDAYRIVEKILNDFEKNQ